jgi:hypothetical protein
VGFSKNAVRFLLHCRSIGVDYSNAATIGRQLLYVNAREVRRSFSTYGQHLSDVELDSIFATGGFAERFLEAMGASAVESFDASPYEGATHVADFNNPIDERFKATYSLVIDGGSLEHVFNYPQGLKNAMEMVRPGGHLILLTPTHSRSGHGFYQLSAELFHRVLCPENGFDAPEVLVCESGSTWFSVTDPKAVGGRIIIDPRRFADELFIVARRHAIVPIYQSWPQQSDYAAAWTRPASAQRLAGLRAWVRENRHRIPRIVTTLRERWLQSRANAANVGLRRVRI